MLVGTTQIKTPAMTTPVFKEITTPLARELAEYVLLWRDLKTASDAFGLWHHSYPFRPDLAGPDRLISQALFRDSVVMFIGCFDKSAPISLSPMDVYNSRDGSLKYFEWLKDIRDSYAAHRFGPLRQCVTGVLVDDAGLVVNATYTWQDYAGPKAAGKDDLLEIVEKAVRFADLKVKALAAQLKAYAKTLTPEQLMALKEASVRPVELHEIRSSRSKFVKRQGS